MGEGEAVEVSGWWPVSIRRARCPGCGARVLVSRRAWESVAWDRVELTPTVGLGGDPHECPPETFVV